ncbi:MAG TPA: hypothetical protein PKA63_07320 [Oligoflexia bacterium]|nr:hypothetical protein [Oligoflexia bacterium]HMP48459.1 hypothetical protein [Oligoflexia bacterium]
MIKPVNITRKTNPAKVEKFFKRKTKTKENFNNRITKNEKNNLTPVKPPEEITRKQLETLPETLFDFKEKIPDNRLLLKKTPDNKLRKP